MYVVYNTYGHDTSMRRCQTTVYPSLSGGYAGPMNRDGVGASNPKRQSGINEKAGIEFYPRSKALTMEWGLNIRNDRIFEMARLGFKDSGNH